MPKRTREIILFPDKIESKIFFIRGQKVMLDSELAFLYGIETKVLNQAVKRNKERFPQDFMFQLSSEEAVSLRSQFVTSKSSGKGGQRYLPYAFTEHGILMLSSVLRSTNAVQVNIQIMRSFIKLRDLISNNESLVKKMRLLEDKYDANFKLVFEVLKELAQEKETASKKKIGFI